MSLQVFPGEIVALIGGNGAGKSTILKVISGLLPGKNGRVSGQVIFKENDLTQHPIEKRIQAGMGYLLQNNNIFDNMTVLENLEQGGVVIPAGHWQDRFEMVVDLFPDLQPRLKHRAGLLSGGQRQMLALGMVLLSDPDLIMLDEPSAGLSPDLVSVIFEAIRRLNTEHGQTFLIVEQNIREVLNVCQRLYCLRNGEVVLEDTTANLLAQNNLEKLFLE